MNEEYLDQLYSTEDDVEFIVMACCSTCGVEHPHTSEFFSSYYYKRKKHLRFTCRACRKIAVKASYDKNREKRLAAMSKRYYAKKENK